MLRDLIASLATARRPSTVRFVQSFVVAAIFAVVGSGACFAQGGAAPPTEDPGKGPPQHPGPLPPQGSDTPPSGSIPGDRSFEVIEGDFATNFVPAVVRGGEQVRVVVIMSGDSVASVRAKAAGHQLSFAQT